MSKEMTPMKRYSTLMSEMKEIVAPYFNELSLNKVDSKYRSFVSHRYWRTQDEPTHTKGVESDFILIFQNKPFALSFALSFNYIDLPKEMQTVVATVKTKNPKSNSDMIVGSAPMSLSVFKQKLLEFNTVYSQKSPGPTSSKDSLLNIVNTFSTIFIDQKFDLKSSVEKSVNQRNDLEKSLKSELQYDNLLSSKEIAEKDLNKTKRLIQKTIDELDETKEVKRLEELLSRAKVELASKKSTIEKTYQLKNKTDVYSKDNRLFSEANQKIEDALVIFDKSLIKPVREQVKEKSKKIF